MLKELTLIGLGGAIGSILRYLIGNPLNLMVAGIPIGTLSVNILGCFIIGTLFFFDKNGSLNLSWKLFLATGLCGGFTTFSAFSAENLVLIQQGKPATALFYTGLSVVSGLLACYIGFSTSKFWL